MRRDGVHMTVSSLIDYSSLVREIEGECAFVVVSGELLVSGSKSGEEERKERTERRTDCLSACLFV